MENFASLTDSSNSQNWTWLQRWHIWPYMSDMLDARGLLCPLPVLKARKRLKPLETGDDLEVWADDPAAVIDMPHFCAEAGHILISSAEADGYQVYILRKGQL